MQPLPAAEQAVRSAKLSLRQVVTRSRAARSPADRATDDTARTAVLTQRLAPSSGCVAAYLSTGSEPSTAGLLGWLHARGGRVLLPVLTDAGGRLLSEPAWAAYEGPDRLRAGARGILEPTGPVLGAAALAEAEVVLCAGLAGDLRGHRLGRGGGWYDRALPYAAVSSRIALLLNDDEVVAAVPTEAWDRPVHALVTPEGWRDID